MIKFYFQYDKERHQAKLVLDGDPAHIEIFFVDEIVCEVPIRTVKQDDTPKFIVRGECKVVWQGSNKITLTNNGRL